MSERDRRPDRPATDTPAKSPHTPKAADARDPAALSPTPRVPPLVRRAARSAARAAVLAAALGATGCGDDGDGGAPDAEIIAPQPPPMPDAAPVDASAPDAEIIAPQPPPDPDAGPLPPQPPPPPDADPPPPPQPPPQPAP
jgi:hypothetical protein